MEIDLTTYYGGLKLKSPLVAGACPLMAQEQTRWATELAGAGAIVLPSVFEEQVILWNERNRHDLTHHDRELVARSRRLPTTTSVESAEAYLALVNQACQRASIPIIASVNGESGGNWIAFAGALQTAGASAIEWNVQHSLFDDDLGPREVEDAIVEAASAISRAIKIPLSMKLGREYTCASRLALRLLSGAQGLALYGRAPDVDVCLDNLQLKTQWGLTQPGSITQSISSLMRIHRRCPVMPLAACGGIGNPSDVVKVLLAGADVAMITSAVYREGADVFRTFQEGLMVFMEKNNMQSMRDLQTRRPLYFESEEERAQYINALSARLDVNEQEPSDHAVHGDRWGHLVQLG